MGAVTLLVVSQVVVGQREVVGNCHVVSEDVTTDRRFVANVKCGTAHIYPFEFART